MAPRTPKEVKNSVNADLESPFSVDATVPQKRLGNGDAVEDGDVHIRLSVLSKEFVLCSLRMEIRYPVFNHPGNKVNRLFRTGATDSTAGGWAAGQQGAQCENFRDCASPRAIVTGNQSIERVPTRPSRD